MPLSESSLLFTSTCVTLCSVRMFETSLLMLISKCTAKENTARIEPKSDTTISMGSVISRKCLPVGHSNQRQDWLQRPDIVVKFLRLRIGEGADVGAEDVTLRGVEKRHVREACDVAGQQRFELPFARREGRKIPWPAAVETSSPGAMTLPGLLSRNETEPGKYPHLLDRRRPHADVASPELPTLDTPVLLSVESSAVAASLLVE